MRHLVDAGQIAFEKVLDAAVGRAHIAGQQPVLGTVGHQQVVGHVHELVAFLALYRVLAGRGQLEVDVQAQVVLLAPGVGHWVCAGMVGSVHACFLNAGYVIPSQICTLTCRAPKGLMINAHA
jgi:hypothetical protein